MKIRLPYIMLALLPLSACSQGQSVTPTLGNRGQQSTNVVVTISKQLQNEKGRSLQYFSINTQSISITTDSGVQQVINISVNSSNCSTINSGGSLSCSFPVNTTVGTHTFTIVAYSEPNGQGSVLSTNTTGPITVAAGGTTTVPLSLNAIVASVAISLPSPVISAGVAAQIPVSAILKDASGAIIVGASNLQNPITLVSSDPVHAQLSKTVLHSAADEAGISIKYDGSAVLPITISATGLGLNTNSMQTATSINTTLNPGWGVGYSGAVSLYTSIYTDVVEPAYYNEFRVGSSGGPDFWESPAYIIGAKSLNYSFSKAVEMSTPHDGIVLDTPLVASDTNNATISLDSGSYEEKISSNTVTSNGHVDHSGVENDFYANANDAITATSTSPDQGSSLSYIYQLALHVTNFSCGPNLGAFGSYTPQITIDTIPGPFSVDEVVESPKVEIFLSCNASGTVASLHNGGVAFNVRFMVNGTPLTGSDPFNNLSIANGSTIRMQILLRVSTGEWFPFRTIITAGGEIYPVIDTSNTILNAVYNGYNVDWKTTITPVTPGASFTSDSGTTYQ